MSTPIENKNYHYKIKDWILNPQTLEISNKEKKLHLQSKVMDVLIELIEANGQIISKEELLNKVWKGTIVTENSLNKTISELRKVFNQSKNDSQFIETIPKKGYRLIVSVKKIEIQHKGIPIYKNKQSLILITIAVIGIGIFLWLNVRKNIEHNSILSPNGTDIAYIKEDGTQFSLFVENLLNGEITKFDSFEQPESIALNWSSDSHNIIYNTTQEKHQFYSISVINTLTKEISYIKFSKSSDYELLNSVDQPKNSTLLDHSKLTQRNNKVHYINYSKTDTIKVLFRDDLINDFKW